MLLLDPQDCLLHLERQPVGVSIRASSAILQPPEPNKAKTRAKRDSRSAPFADLVTREVTAEDPAVDASHFHGPNGAEPGHWRGEVVPNRWAADPERDFISNETIELIKKAMDGLPDAQRAVMMLRDLQGFSSEEACNALEISETNQRVLLHRARAKVRRALDELFCS